MSFKRNRPDQSYQKRKPGPTFTTRPGTHHIGLRTESPNTSGTQFPHFSIHHHHLAYVALVLTQPYPHHEDCYCHSNTKENENLISAKAASVQKHYFLPTHQ